MSGDTAPDRLAAGRVLPAERVGEARAGDCISGRRGLSCLPAVINIGVQKAGTGELQTWLGAHPAFLAHGGEAHFFDGPAYGRSCDTPRERDSLRLHYARFLWRRRQLDYSEVAAGPLPLAGAVGGAGRGLGRARAGTLRDALPLVSRVPFEKTPAYFDMADPALVACVVPSARLLVMLREPVARAASAYQMCQNELHARWCREPLDAALLRALVDSRPPRLNGSALARAPQLRRLLTIGLYTAHLSRWLVHVPQMSVRVLWLEHFKAEPFDCMTAIEGYLGLPRHDFRQQASRNDAGLWVVGRSKSTSPAGPRRRISPAVNATLRRFYAPWQRTLAALLHTHNLSLLPGAPLPN